MTYSNDDISRDPNSSNRNTDSSWNFDVSSLIANQSSEDSAPATQRSNPGLPTDSSNELLRETVKRGCLDPNGECSGSPELKAKRRMAQFEQNSNSSLDEKPVVPTLSSQEWNEVGFLLSLGKSALTASMRSLHEFALQMASYMYKQENQSEITFSNIRDCNGDLITVKMPHFIFLMLASGKYSAAVKVQIVTEYHNLSCVPNWPTAVREINAVIDCLNQKR